jgi:hypothetical protein
MMKNTTQRGKVTALEMQPLFARDLLKIKTVQKTRIALQDYTVIKRTLGHLKRAANSIKKLAMCARMTTSA